MHLAALAQEPVCGRPVEVAMRSKSTKGEVPARPDELFDRVVRILEQARGNVIRSVNTNMVLAYWLIGREIVEAVQKGEDRAEYGQQVVRDLAARLTDRYGRGFSLANLKNFRQFYLCYPERCMPIGYPAGSQSEKGPIQYLPGTKSSVGPNSSSAGRNSALAAKSHLPGDESAVGFSPLLHQFESRPDFFVS